MLFIAYTDPKALKTLAYNIYVFGVNPASKFLFYTKNIAVRLKITPVFYGILGILVLLLGILYYKKRHK
jgi:hypothetical protein